MNGSADMGSAFEFLKYIVGGRVIANVSNIMIVITSPPTGRSEEGKTKEQPLKVPTLRISHSDVQIIIPQRIPKSPSLCQLGENAISSEK